MATPDQSQSKKRWSTRSPNLSPSAASGTWRWQERIDKQHAAGKMTARERSKLTDRELRGDRAVCRHRATYFGMANKETARRWRGHRKRHIDGRLVHLASQDFTVAGGAAGELHSDKIADMMQPLAQDRAVRSSSSTTPAARACRRASTVWRLRPRLLQQCACCPERCPRFP